MGEKLTRTQIKNLERFGGVNPADETFSRRQFAAQVGGYARLPAERWREGCGSAIDGEWRGSSHRHRYGSRTTRSSSPSAGQT